MVKKSELGPRWFDLSTMANAFGVTPRGFHETIRPLVPIDGIKDGGKRGKVRINCRATIDAFADKKVSQALAVSKQDPLLIGGDGDSPSLERLRAATATLREMDVRERTKTHVDVKELAEALTRFGNRLRGAGETLQRKYGNDASDILNQAIDEALKHATETVVLA